MSTNLICDSPILGLVLRVRTLNACGVPITGTGTEIVMDGFVKIDEAPQYDTGDRKILRKANGTLCQNFKLPDQFTNSQITADFCVFNPGLLVATIGARLDTLTSSPTGTGVAHGTWANASANHWSLEVWGSPPQSCDATGIVYYPYYAWPHLANAKRGNTTISNDPYQLEIIAESQDASPLWTVGNAYLGAGFVQQGDHWERNLSTVAPPTSTCLINTV